MRYATPPSPYVVDCGSPGFSGIQHVNGYLVTFNQAENESISSGTG